MISVDQDTDGWLVDHPDRETTTRLLRQNTIHRYGEGWAGRRMPGLFRAAGLRDVDVVATTHIDTVKDSHLHDNVLRMLAEQVAAGLVPEREADRWRDQKRGPTPLLLGPDVLPLHRHRPHLARRNGTLSACGRRSGTGACRRSCCSLSRR